MQRGTVPRQNDTFINQRCSKNTRPELTCTRAHKLGAELCTHVPLPCSPGPLGGKQSNFLLSFPFSKKQLFYSVKMLCTCNVFLFQPNPWCARRAPAARGRSHNEDHPGQTEGATPSPSLSRTSKSTPDRPQKQDAANAYRYGGSIPAPSGFLVSSAQNLGQPSTRGGARVPLLFISSVLMTIGFTQCSIS